MTVDIEYYKVTDNSFNGPYYIYGETDERWHFDANGRFLINVPLGTDPTKYRMTAVRDTFRDTAIPGCTSIRRPK
jgi:hypothetical protein